MSIGDDESKPYERPSMVRESGIRPDNHSKGEVRRQKAEGRWQKIWLTFFDCDLPSPFCLLPSDLYTAVDLPFGCRDNQRLEKGSLIFESVSGDREVG